MKLPRRAYDRYMRSDEWLERRAAYFFDHAPECAMCGSIHVHLHHLDYRHLGNEQDDDLLPLCRQHHDGVHEHYEANRAWLTLRQATARHVAEHGGPSIDEGEPLPPLRNGRRWAELVTVACPTCEAQPGEACVYEHRGRVRIVTAGGGHKARKAAASRARRLAS